MDCIHPQHLTKRRLNHFFSFTNEQFIFAVVLIAIFLLLPLAVRLKLGKLKDFQGKYYGEFTKNQIFRLNFAALLIREGTFILRSAIV